MRLNFHAGWAFTYHELSEKSKSMAEKVKIFVFTLV